VRIRVLAPLVVVTALAWSGVAHAAVRCVGTTGADCTTTHATTTDAVAAAVTGVDTIRFGVGTFGPVATSKVLTYVGAGAGTPDSAAGATVIQQTTASEHGMNLPQGGTVRALRVQGGPSSGTDSAGGGIQFAPTTNGDMALTLIDVIATGGATAVPATPGGAGLALGGSLTATGSKVATVTGGAFLGSSTPGGGGLGVYTCCIQTNITGALIRTASGPGVYASIGSTLTLDASSVEGTQAIQTQAPNSLTVRRSRVTGVSAGMVIRSDSSAPTPVVVRDSLVTTGATDAVAAAQILGENGSPVVFDAVGSTFIGRGNSQAAVIARRTADMSAALTVTLRNSVARAESSTGFDLLADRATIGADFSSFNTRSLVNGGLAPEPGSAGNVAGDPLLAADYSLQSGSPLVDRGDPSALVPGELDLVGSARSLDGNGDCATAPDIGAFERPDACPATGPGPAPSPNLAPKLTNVSVTNKIFAPVRRVGAGAVKRGTRFRYTLSEPARVTITIERVLPGRVRRSGTRRTCVKPTARNRRARRCKRYKRVTALVADERAGRQSTAFTGRVRGRALRPGPYRARLVASDALGARSAVTRIALRVVRP
jgi:hypothetical protein